MKQIKYFAASSALAFLPMIAGAQGNTFDSGNDLQGYLSSVLVFINDVIIPLILGVAFLFFVWGMFQYFIAGGANEEAREKGKSLLIYAILGFVLIIVFWGLINFLTASTGLQDDAVDNVPGVGGITI